MGRADTIRDAVEDQLTFDSNLDVARSDITAKTINGEVALGGIVPSYPQYLAAGAAAGRVGLTGVRSVKNNIQIRADADQPTSR
jgi:osmotically-inducible protein OsmY